MALKTKTTTQPVGAARATTHLHIRLTPRQKALLTSTARYRGLTVSQFVHRWIDGLKKK